MKLYRAIWIYSLINLLICAILICGDQFLPKGAIGPWGNYLGWVGLLIDSILGTLVIHLARKMQVVQGGSPSIPAGPT